MNAKDLRTHRPFLTIACLLLVLVIAFACNGDSSSTGTGTDSEIDNNIVSPPVKVVDLNLIISSGGSATADCSSSCSGESGWVTSVVAYPNMGYEFVQWQCTGSCPPGIDNTNARTTLTIRQDTHLVPVFQQALESQQVVGLTLATSSGGSAVADCNPNCIGEPGWTATIETMANPGLQLLGYSCFGDGCPNTIPDTEVLNIVVNGDIILTPIFGEASETTLAIITAENGSASINNNGCDSTRTCTDQPGWTATVEATANTGFQLLRYSCSGDGCPNTIPNTERLSLTVDGDITLTPVFGEIPEATLAIGTAENGRAGINNDGCDSTRTCTDQPGWTATVEATANTGFQLLSYSCSGDGCPNTIPNTERLSLTVNGDITLTPVFGEIPEATLTIGTAEDGRAGINNDGCDSTRICTDQPGWNATIEATANTGFQLLRYSCSGDGCPRTIPNTERLSITVNGDIILTPVFGEIPEAILTNRNISPAPVFGENRETTLTIATAEGGGASINNDGCDSIRTCTDQTGWTATVEATANTGFQLLRYSCSGDGCPRTIPNTERLSITVNGDIILTPVFGEIPETTLTIGTAEGGSVSITNVGCNSMNTCTNIQGWTATVEATANTGFQLLRYSCSGDSCPNPIPDTEQIEITVDGDITLTPVFVPETTLTIATTENGSARITNNDCDSESTCTGRQGWTATVEATVDTGLWGVRLLHYDCSGDGCPNPIPNTEQISITINGDITLTPVFGIPRTNNLRVLLDSNWTADNDQGQRIFNRGQYILSDEDGDFRAFTQFGSELGPSAKAAVWAPDGTKFAFISLDQDATAYSQNLYVVNKDGTRKDARRVTSYSSSPNPDPPPLDRAPSLSNPFWSPDSARIFFTADTIETENKFEIYSVKPDGTDFRQITNMGGINHRNSRNIRLSPDGTKIAFTYCSQIHIVNSTGGSPIRITNPTIECGDGIARVDIRWSPDSTKLAFTSYDSTKGRGSGALNISSTLAINIIDVDGSNHRQFTGDPTSNMVPGQFSIPHWSPDGTKIAFSVYPQGELGTLSGFSRIALINADGSNFNQITENSQSLSVKSTPQWSPDGKYLAFLASSTAGSSTYFLYTINPSGSILRQVSNGIRARDFDWSPDGTQLAFLSVDGIYTVDLSGSDVRKTPIGFENHHNAFTLSFSWVQE